MLYLNREIEIEKHSHKNDQEKKQIKIQVNSLNQKNPISTVTI